METEFEDAILRRMSTLERRLHLIKPGAITDVDPLLGIRINWGAEDEKFKSPWINPSHHNGYICEHMPWKVGQNVLSIGMDPEHRTALIIPHAPNDQNPPDKDASNTEHTYRIRDPGAAGTQSGQAVSPPGQGAPGTPSGPAQIPPGQPAKDDDANDYRHARSYLKHTTSLGAKLTRSASRETKDTGHKINDQVATDGQSGKFNSHTIDPLQILVQFASGFISHLLDKVQFLVQVSNSLHSFFVHAQNGIQASANNGQHTTTWLNGIIHKSAVQISNEAPITNISQILKVSGLSQMLGGLSTGAFEIEPDADGVPGAATINGTIKVTGLGTYADDADAEAAGVPVNGVYISSLIGALIVRRPT